jgi:hypothetical protein
LDLRKAIVQGTLQQVLEAEMDEALQVGKGGTHSGPARIPLGLLQPDADSPFAGFPISLLGPIRLALELDRKSSGGLWLGLSIV